MNDLKLGDLFADTLLDLIVHHPKFNTNLHNAMIEFVQDGLSDIKLGDKEYDEKWERYSTAAENVMTEHIKLIVPDVPEDILASVGMMLITEYV